MPPKEKKGRQPSYVVRVREKRGNQNRKMGGGVICRGNRGLRRVFRGVLQTKLAGGKAIPYQSGRCAARMRVQRRAAFRGSQKREHTQSSTVGAGHQPSQADTGKTVKKLSEARRPG